MAIKIRTKAGGSKSTSARSTKTAPKRTASKSTSTAKRTTAKKSTSTGRKRGGPRGPRTPNLPKGVLDKHTKALEAAGQDLAEAQQAHEDATNAVYAAAGAALEANVPMSIVSDLTGVSRQWLYKMGEHAGRNGSGSKSAAKRAAKSGVRGKSTATKRTTTRGRKPAAKSGKRGGVKIRSRS